MLNIHVLTLGEYQTNTYIVHDSDAKTCALIDPGYHPQRILSALEELGLTVDAILLTHGHFDHVGAVEAIVEATGCALWMSQRDWTQFKTPENDYYYPLHDRDFTEVRFCEEDESIHAGGLTFRVMETPGHTWGSVCYICQEAIFSGDTLFRMGCGRTDLPGGDLATIQASLERLAELEGDFTVCPGHGGTTCLSHERRWNPYMRK